MSDIFGANSETVGSLWNKDAAQRGSARLGSAPSERPQRLSSGLAACARSHTSQNRVIAAHHVTHPRVGGATARIRIKAPRGYCTDAVATPTRLVSRVTF